MWLRARWKRRPGSGWVLIDDSGEKRGTYRRRINQIAHAEAVVEGVPYRLEGIRGIQRELRAHDSGGRVHADARLVPVLWSGSCTLLTGDVLTVTRHLGLKTSRFTFNAGTQPVMEMRMHQLSAELSFDQTLPALAPGLIPLQIFLLEHYRHNAN